MARYAKGHKGETRARIIELASKRFRKEGIDGVGVATLMADAGLTNGGFYAHFASKEELIKEAVLHGLGKLPGEATWEGEPDLPQLIRDYLSTKHRTDAASGCAMAALSGDLARRPAESRQAIEEKGMGLLRHIADGLPASVAAEERMPRAIAVFSHMLGTLQMARFVPDAEASEAILARGREEAMRIAGFAS
ncbi:Transcriptional regulator, TetR family [Beijerinckiaceae bacterium RH AL1]|nr:TetR family transcriptional regulator [Beijerinckiaceae bacterium]VVB48389.1 Transcriptional regulator, TetR family [Beijerinckiaceae bacterium RH CH11]VVB48470.1 Transcriptional regulator, TetR family [Beijerinckiaceae bacterium RH AL8]VVC56370.1 Transcriptional regulator, TetR family [Beijerinckiaceae bacterium RH AL1]